MTTKATEPRRAAIQQVRAVIEGLDRDGALPVDTGGSDHDFRTVAITTSEGEALRRWIRRENAAHTIEIGLAFGFSALFICEGLLLTGNPTPRTSRSIRFSKPDTPIAGWSSSKRPGLAHS